MPQLLLFPCNGNAVEALDALDAGWDVLGFVDDALAKQGTLCHGLTVHSRAAFARWPEAQVLAVPGSPQSYRARRAAIEGLGCDARWAQVIHPAARVSRHARLGRHVLLMAGVVVCAGAVVGEHVCILPNSVIHHDARIGDFSLVGSNVSVAGGARVGENCYLASGSSVIDGAEIGDFALVGLASTVLRGVAPNARVAGSPARVLG